MAYKHSIDRYAGSPGSRSASASDPTSVPDLKHSEARRAKTMADLKDIDLQQRLGQLVPIDDVASTLQDVAKGLQTEILGFPSRVVEQILAIRERPELFAFLTAEAATLCTRLSTLRIGSADDLAEPEPDPDPDETDVDA